MAGQTYQQLAAATRTERIYWGVSSSPANTEAFIEALPGLSVTNSRVAITFTVGATGANKIYVAAPTHLGTLIFSSGGFDGGFITRATGITVTNTLGIILPYNLYESVSAGLGITTISVRSP